MDKEQFVVIGANMKAMITALQQLFWQQKGLLLQMQSIGTIGREYTSLIFTKLRIRKQSLAKAV